MWGFQRSILNSLFVLWTSRDVLWVLVYIVDINISSSNAHHVDIFIQRLNHHFSFKDFGLLSFFLGIEAHHTPTGLYLSQIKYSGVIKLNGDA